MNSRVAVWIVVFAIFATGSVWAGDNVWTSLGPDGGSISSLVIDPQNTSTVYAGTQGNGVLKSLDGGTSWNQASMGFPGTWVMALAIDPQNSRTLYASVFGHGVFKSTDGGASWNAARAGLPTYDAIDGYGFVPILVIDPQHPDTVYAAIGDDASTGGVYKTTD